MSHALHHVHLLLTNLTCRQMVHMSLLSCSNVLRRICPRYITPEPHRTQKHLSRVDVHRNNSFSRVDVHRNTSQEWMFTETHLSRMDVHRNTPLPSMDVHRNTPLSRMDVHRNTSLQEWMFPKTPLSKSGCSQKHLQEWIPRF